MYAKSRKHDHMNFDMSSVSHMLSISTCSGRSNIFNCIPFFPRAVSKLTQVPKFQKLFSKKSYYEISVDDGFSLL